MVIRRRIDLGNAAVGTTQPAGNKSLEVHLAAVAKLIKANKCYPLSAPGMGVIPVNSAFLRFAQLCGDGSEIVKQTVKQDGKPKTVSTVTVGNELPKLIAGALYDPSFVLPIELSRAQWTDVQWIPGHLWSREVAPGPRAADVMVIGKSARYEDTQAGFVFSGTDGEMLRECFREARFPDIPKIYVTYLNKFASPKNDSNLRASWKADGSYLLQHEIRLVRPKYILCLGTEPLKALMGDEYSVTECEGQVYDYVYDARLNANDNCGDKLSAKLLTVINPRQVIRDPGARRQLESGIMRFSRLVKTGKTSLVSQSNHRMVDNLPDLLDALQLMETSPEKRDSVVSVDAEWQGSHPGNKGSYVRTVQFSHLPGHALCVKLHEAGGAVCEGFACDGGLHPAVAELLTAYLAGGTFEGTTFKPKRVVGHFFNSDLEWLLHLKIDVQSCFRVPLYDYLVTDEQSDKRSVRYIKDGFKPGELVPAWYRTKYEGGADTGLMVHAIEEASSPYDLSTVCLRYTTIPRYDTPLLRWKNDYCKQRGISEKSLEGYGDCPDDILVPYSLYDADAGLQLYYALHPLLDYDHDGNSCREAFWESQIATTGVLDMHRTGIVVNRQRVDQLYKLFSEKKEELITKLRELVRWPELNIRSNIQAKELLYGYKLNGKLDELNNPVKVSPVGAVLLNLEPVLSTGKPAKRWEEIPVSRRKEHSPTTAAVAMSLLQQALAAKIGRSSFDEFRIKVLDLVSDYKYVDQVLKTVLRPPQLSESTGEAVYDDDGNMSYESGLVSYTCDDGRIRTHIYQTKETGRWSTARPNLQNMAKKREKDYVRIFGDAYEKSRLRSIMRAAEGSVLLEVDYIGAELFGMAVLSGDKVMIDHVMRNQLSEDDPNYYDIHSNMAVQAFRLRCPATKAGLESIGKGALRIIAKSILFGLAYGRGPAAIALEAKQQNVDMSVVEAQGVIDTIFGQYPELHPFLRQARLRATGQWRNPDGTTAGRFLCNSFGRYRRFPETTDRSLLGEFERQAMNFPLQSLVASAVSRAVAYLADFRDKHYARTGERLFSLLLQIHDALLLEVPYAYLRRVSEKIIPLCMRKMVPIYPTDLGGSLISNTPYYLGIDGEVMLEWGHKIPTQQANLLGLPTGQFRGDGVSIVYSK